MRPRLLILLALTQSAGALSSFVGGLRLSLQGLRFAPQFQPVVPTQYIAALGDPAARAGAGAEAWGLWRQDPGPRGVHLFNYQSLYATGGENGLAKVGWKWAFDPNDFWIEEFGRLMEKPEFPLPTGRYIVTGGREVATTLTVDERGGWQLGEGTLSDVTHLPCRSARYTPTAAAAKIDSSVGNNGAAASKNSRMVPVGGSPAAARLADYPVAPGAPMPPIPGCDKADYAVLFVVAVERR
jgi:hypothetical protein